jgi:hypothetical protein
VNLGLLIEGAFSGAQEAVETILPVYLDGQKITEVVTKRQSREFGRRAGFRWGRDAQRPASHNDARDEIPSRCGRASRHARAPARGREGRRARSVFRAREGIAPSP